MSRTSTAPQPTDGRSGPQPRRQSRAGSELRAREQQPEAAPAISSTAADERRARVIQVKHAPEHDQRRRERHDARQLALDGVELGRAREARELEPSSPSSATPASSATTNRLPHRYEHQQVGRDRMPA